jgi:KUP system potassium uptake protein
MAGVAIACDMAITTFLVSVVMLIVWKKSFWKVALFTLPFNCIEGIYLSSLMVKFTEGGFLPLVSAAFFSSVMGVWFWVQKKVYEYEIQNQIPSERLREMVGNLNTYRMPGIGILYSELSRGTLPIFPRLITSLPCLHSVVVLVSIKATPISRVASEDRYIFGHVEGREYRIFTCTIRHGYSDSIGDLTEFESDFIRHLKEYIRHCHEQQVEAAAIAEQSDEEEENTIAVPRVSSDSIQPMDIVESERVENEVELVETARRNGVAYMFGEIEIMADPNSSMFKKAVVWVFNFLRKNLEHMDNFMAIPRKRLLKIGITYEL